MKYQDRVRGEMFDEAIVIQKVATLSSCRITLILILGQPGKLFHRLQGSQNPHRAS